MKTGLGRDPQFVPVELLPLVVGRDNDADWQAGDGSVSRLHAQVSREAGTIVLRDRDSRFGTYVNEQRIRQCTLRLGDHIRFGNRVTYRYEETGFRRVGEASGLGLRAQGLTIGVGQRILVQGVILDVPPGEFVGLLGPSGVGKTMLLRALAGIRAPLGGHVSTDATYDRDIWSDRSDLELHWRTCGFIPQDDVVYPLLTVRENLRFVAYRLSNSSRTHSSEEQIDELLTLLGLTEHQHKQARYLSGGQRKRLSVAVELLRQPAMLFLDEPTSGLDPATEAGLMTYFRQIARQRGVTVICSSHLTGNLLLFDRVLVLARRAGCEHASAAYYGEPHTLLAHFGCRDFPSFYEKLQQGDFTAPETPRTAAERRPLSASFRHYVASHAGGTFARDWATVVVRSPLTICRDRWFAAFVLIQPLVLALLLALTQFNPGSISSLLFFTVVVACWLGMNNAIRELVRDRRPYIRDRLAGLSPGAYLLGKWTVFAAVGIGQLLLFCTVLTIALRPVLPKELDPQWQDVGWIHWLAILWMTYIGALGAALTVSAWVNSEESAVSWLPILILPQVLLSAFGTGVSALHYDTDARPFRPLRITLRHPFTAAKSSEELKSSEKLSRTAVLVDVASLGVLSRPAYLALEKKQVEGFPESMWIADLTHLFILLILSYLALWNIFRWREQAWPALVGY